MKKAIIIRAVVIATLIWIMFRHECRITALERRAVDYDYHFGYKSQFPCVGLFGVYENDGGAK